MIGFWRFGRAGPIGVDIGSSAVKLLQLSADRQQVLESVCWELPRGEDGLPIRTEETILETLRRVRQARNFRGREVVLALGPEELFIQNLRLPESKPDNKKESFEKLVLSEAASRLPFEAADAEIRFLQTEPVRQADTVRLEVIVLACRRAVIEQKVSMAERAGFVPVALEPQPIALLRCYSNQYRRQSDQQRRSMYVNIGANSTMVLITRGNDLMFIKSIPWGGRSLDEAVAQHLKMSLPEASALRRHHGDRRADQRDPEVTLAIQEAVRPLWDRLANELSMCTRYFCITFRGEPLSSLVLGGGEACRELADWLAGQLNLPCELADPFRSFQTRSSPGRHTQWDVATGLALHETSKH
ncbi:MAG: pilus assembly protein PilM [Thermoguttaceae bacterium]|nr:pilus assembly protein PilM [Thermoguttaceae bacterium]MDW8038336.1 pilus assembly protein PilM [Thermoguttaceae bacterium]